MHDLALLAIYRFLSNISKIHIYEVIIKIYELI